MKTGSCPLNHTAKTCWTVDCNSSACEKRHPRPCNLFFRSVRGCHRSNCSHRHLPPQHAPTVLLAGHTAAGAASAGPASRARLSVLVAPPAAAATAAVAFYSRKSRQDCLVGLTYKAPLKIVQLSPPVSVLYPVNHRRTYTENTVIIQFFVFIQGSHLSPY